MTDAWKVAGLTAGAVVALAAAGGVGVMAGTLVGTQNRTDTGTIVLTEEETWDLLADHWNESTPNERDETCDLVYLLGTDGYVALVAGWLVEDQDAAIIINQETAVQLYEEACGG